MIKHINHVEYCHLCNIIEGFYYPLSGFCTYPELVSIYKDSKVNNIPWFMPVVLGIENNERISDGDELDLMYNDIHVATMQVRDVTTYNKEQHLDLLYKESGIVSEGKKYISNSNCFTVGGKVDPTPEYYNLYSGSFTLPFIKESIEKEKWKTVAFVSSYDFMTRPMEHLIKTLLETYDGIVIQSIVDPLDPNSMTPNQKIDCHKESLRFFPMSRVIFTVIPKPVYSSDLLESLTEALIAKNVGATTCVFMGNQLGEKLSTYLKTISPLGIDVLDMPTAFFCRKCDALVTNNSCPHLSTSREYFTSKDLIDIKNGGTDHNPNLIRDGVVEAIKKTTVNLV